ncbi:unnamed protein product, partial [Prunus brigantina]
VETKAKEKPIQNEICTRCHPLVYRGIPCSHNLRSINIYYNHHKANNAEDHQ